MTRSAKILVLTVSLSVVAAGFAGCGGADALSNQTAEAAVSVYAEGAYRSYQASFSSAESLDSAVDVFLANPTEELLQAARGAWLAARSDYAPTEAFRFYGGPTVIEERGYKTLVNAWPANEAYIDYTVANPDSGIVNDVGSYPLINTELLVSLHQAGDETNVATGWQAIEFLLWGEDSGATGSGERPVSDYTDAPNAQRRSVYLAEATDLLVAHMGEMVVAWAPDNGLNYRASFEGLDSNEALRRMIVGVGELSRGQLAGQRMSVASPNDEYSDFSDNTTNDIIGNAEGIQRVLTGDYPGVSGPGIADVVGEVDSELAKQLLAEAEMSVASVGTIPAPFDQHLGDGVDDDAPGRQQLLVSIKALEDQTDTMVAAAAVLGLTVNVS